MDTKTLTALATVVAEVTKAVLSSPKKLSVLTIGGLILSLGDDVKIIGEGYKDIPYEYWDTDSDEGQELSMIIKQKLGDQADNTIVDDFLGALLCSVWRVKSDIDVLIGDYTFETKGNATGSILALAGKLLDSVLHKKQYNDPAPLLALKGPVVHSI